MILQAVIERMEHALDVYLILRELNANFAKRDTSEIQS
jgi:hypothetical protein